MFEDIGTWFAAAERALSMYQGQMAAWALTLVSEAIIAAALARSFGLAAWKAAAAAVLGSLVTHPNVWWLHHHLLWELGYWPSFAIVEGYAVLVESAFYCAAGARLGTAIAISFVVNAGSVLAGFAMYAIQGSFG